MSLLAKIRLLGKILAILDRREKTQLLVLAGMMVVGAGLEVIGIGAVTSFIGVLARPEVIQEHPALSTVYEGIGAASAQEFLIYAGFFLVVVFLTKNGYLAFLIHSLTKFAFQKEIALSEQLLSAYLHKPYVFHLQRNSAELVRNVTAEVSHVVTGVMVPGLILLTEGIVLAFVLFLLAAVEPFIALTIFLLLATVALTFIQAVKAVLSRAGRQRSRASGLRIKWVNQGLGGIKETKLLGREEFFSHQFRVSTEAYAKSGLIANTLSNLPRLIVEVVAVTAILTLFIVSQKQGRALQELLPILVLFSVATMRLMPSINRMTPAFNQLRYWFPALEVVHHDLITISHEQAPTRESVKSFCATEREPTLSDITLRDVWYRHPNVSSWSLRGISLRINRGSAIAIMGSSGAGKSTLLDLILGLLDPSKGEIYIGNVRLAETREHWQRCIGYVPQSIYLIDDSIKKNVALGVRDADIDEGRVWDVLRAARLDEMVDRLPAKLDTEVGERGVRLSGGERQRIGIARALYHNPNVLVFDEATSALDQKTEQEIAETIKSLVGEKTLIIVAHRLSTVRSAGQIFLLSHGSLVGTGAFEELLANNAEFRSLAGELSRSGLVSDSSAAIETHSVASAGGGHQ